MKNIELLCPAGNREMLEMAIHNGADAVYLSGIRFGARKFSNNFNDDEIIEAIKFAHLYCVKVYVTVNTLIKDDEVKEFINFIELIHINGVDAVLMQDLGMIYLVRKTFPNLEIHASTQFHNHNIEGLKFLKSIGVKRAVLARELSINEIKMLNVDIEKEVFVHGALCISYSGECLMSSMVMNRSGNRGECAGMCRLPYKLIKNKETIQTKGDYLLSPKELCTINNIKEILETNIDSIKIEGRMKSPEYVGFITRLYRKALDNYYKNKEIKISYEDNDKLKVLFNREFTKGYILNDTKNIMNQDSPNHQGIEIGKIIKVTKEKITIKLTKELNQGDAVRFKKANKGMYANFIYKNNKLVNYGKPDEIIELDNKINMTEKDTLLKTIDIKLINEINNYAHKKIPININIIGKINQPLKVEFSDGTNIVREEGIIIEESINYSLTADTIIEKISKLGNSVYKIEKINIDIDNNIFIPIKELNEIRRKLVEKLNAERIKPKSDYLKNKVTFKKNNNNITHNISILIETEEDYLSFNNKNIEFYTEDENLYNKYKNNKNIFLRLPRVINNFKEYNNDLLITSDLGSINKYVDKNIIYSDIYSNVTNIYTAKYLSEMGVKKIGLSPELTTEEINKLYKNYIDTFNEIPNFEMIVYGKIELMLLKHCILNKNLSSSSNCNICKEKDKYYLEDRNKEKYRILQKNCKTTILNYKILNKLNDINDTKISNLYVSLIDLNKEEKNKIKRWLK